MKGPIAEPISPVDATSFERFGAKSLSLASNIKVEGERAHLLYTERTAPTANVVGNVPESNIAVTVLAKTQGSPFLMDRYIDRIANGAKPLTDAQIEAKFGTDPVAAQAVSKFAADHGLSVVDQTTASGRIVLEGISREHAKSHSELLFNNSKRTERNSVEEVEHCLFRRKLRHTSAAYWDWTTDHSSTRTTSNSPICLQNWAALKAQDLLQVKLLHRNQMLLVQDHCRQKKYSKLMVPIQSSMERA